MELKPFLHEATIQLGKDFKLTLTLDYRVIYEIESLFAPKGMLDLIGELMTSSSTMTQFLFFMTRKHHPDLSHDVIAGVQFSPKYGQLVYASVGKIMKDAFNLKAARNG